MVSCGLSISEFHSVLFSGYGAVREIVLPHKQQARAELEQH